MSEKAQPGRGDVHRKRTAILVSGSGTNMRSLIEASLAADYPAQIVTIISNKADAKALERAGEYGIEAHAVPHRDYPDRASHERAIDALLAEAEVELVCLAGYMRLLTEQFVRRWQGRMINIHPALLPLFKGLDTHQRALDAGMVLHGCTVHFVTEGMDDGPIIAQAAVPVLPGETAEMLARRVQSAEHRLYPHALRLVASGQAVMSDGRTRFDAALPDDGRLLLSPAPPSEKRSLDPDASHDGGERGAA